MLGSLFGSSLRLIMMVGGLRIKGSIGVFYTAGQF